MDFFERFTSNTYAGSANQLYFNMPDDEVRTGRILYKISYAGEYNYSILFSNIMDSTYANGSVSHKNLICDSWKIHSARIGRCKEINNDKSMPELTMADDFEGKDADVIASDFKEITFNGKKEKDVMPGEFFSSDPIKLNFDANEYLSLEITFSGKMIPYHEETLIPVFAKFNGEWKYYKHVPFAGMVGCDRSVKTRVAYLGDSITQGVGAPLNSYLHWNALLSQKIGGEYSYWNLGIGYARASDAASDGAWLYKAKQNDVIFVCYGVNDILQNSSEEQIKTDLTTIVDILKKDDKKVILQTVPPFNYIGETVNKWKRINEYIKTVLKEKVDYVFDVVPHLADGDSAYAKFGQHPSAEGSAIWSEALYEEIKHLF